MCQYWFHLQYPKLETTQIFFSGWTGKPIMINPHHKLQFSIAEEYMQQLDKPLEGSMLSEKPISNSVLPNNSIYITLLK